jgi:hypothetical protein
LVRTPGKPFPYLPPKTEPRDRLEAALHDITNALSAARSLGDVALLRSKAKIPIEPSLLESILAEIDRANTIVRRVRHETFRSGDVLTCLECGHTFVCRTPRMETATCRRCKSANVERWKPPA